MGSPVEAIAPLEALYHEQTGPDSSHELIAVVSQPPRLKGRGRKKHPEDPPVASWAKLKDLKVLQPEKARDESFLAELAELKPDVVVTCAYGQILTDSFLSIPTRGTINIHPSALPKYRGATPVPAALLAGETVTAVTILFTVRALDAGAVIDQKFYEIAPDETSGQLTDRLFKESGPLLIHSLKLLEDSDFAGVPQNEAGVTKCGKITKEMGEIDWSQSVLMLYRKYRAFNPWPGIFGNLNGFRVGVEKMSIEQDPEGRYVQDAVGSMSFDEGRKAIRLQGSDGWIYLHLLKPAGKKAMDAKAFWNGYCKKSKEV